MSTRFERGATRTVAGLSLLLMLAAPLSLIPTIWHADFRWMLSGVVLGFVGLGLGWLIQTTGKRIKHTTNGEI